MMRIENLPSMLSKEEMENLMKSWNNESWKVLVERNMRLALKVSRSFLSTGIEEEELYSISLIGLIKAAKKFNPEYGNAFSTYAVPTIKNEILIFVRKNKTHPYPNISLNEKIELENGKFCERFAVIESDFNLESHMIQNDLARSINAEINKLKDRDREIILLYLRGMQQRKIGQILGFSQPQISRVLKRFKEKIRKYRQ